MIVFSNCQECGAAKKPGGPCRDRRCLEACWYRSRQSLEETLREDVAEHLCQAAHRWREGLVGSTTMEAGMTHLTLKQEFERLQVEIHDNAVQHGWWPDQRSTVELLALIHSEVSEAVEAIRDGNMQSDHIRLFSGLEEELADIVIRCMHLAETRGLRLFDAIVAKHEYNKTRPFRHGGKKL